MKLCRELSDLVVYTNSVAAHDVVEDGMRGCPHGNSEALPGKHHALVPKFMLKLFQNASWS